MTSTSTSVSTPAAPAMRVAVDATNALGECVLWCERTGRVLWTDILGSMLWAFHPQSGGTSCWPMPERLASFALTDDDDCLLLGLASGLAFFNISTGNVRMICRVEADFPTTRLNDGRCDREGRFVFGTLNEDPARAPIGGFYRLGHDLRLERLPLKSVAIANSICFSPDGRTMYYCDSLDKAIHCCDYNADGTVANERLFVDVRALGGDPDGSTVDAEGYIWTAQWGASKVTRFAPDGTLDRVLRVPASQPSCVAFGGPQLDTLYVTSARVDLSPEALALEPQAGSLFCMADVGVRGLPEQRFQGGA